MAIGRLLLFLLTMLAFVMAGLSVLISPPALWVPVLFAVLYLGVIGWGVMSPQLGMFGDAVCFVKGARGAVALTFDDGPDPVGTRHVLSELRKSKARATFFVVGKKAEKHPEVLREIIEQGHSLGVHSYAHYRFYSLFPPERVRRDIEQTRDIIEQATGVRPVWFRPPIGQMSPRTAAGVESAGAVTIGWNVRARDGLRRTTDEDCLKRIERGLGAGSIVLLHDAWEFEEIPAGSARDACPAGVRTLGRIIEECKRRGLDPVTIEGLLSREER